jgi:hypothetical protein
VTVTWRGFDSIKEVPSTLAKEAFATKGRTGVDHHLATPAVRPNEDGWTTVIFHSQTRQIQGWSPPPGSAPDQPCSGRLNADEVGALVQSKRGVRLLDGRRCAPFSCRRRVVCRPILSGKRAAQISE